MKSVFFRHTRVVVAATALVSVSGCAHQAKQEAAAHQNQQVQSLQARLDESERNNGRLTVRIEELEDAVFLLQDRVDANRIALQRRGIMGPQATGNTYAAGQVGPAPETHWNSPPPSSNPYVQEARPVTRIPLANDSSANPYDEPYVDQVPTNQVPTATTATTEDSELVIGENEFRAFEQRFGDPRSSSSSKGAPRHAQPPVTDERLPTTSELGSDSTPAKTDAPPRSSSRKDALSTYKDALADYRGGNYGAALAGFETFLASGPQADYVDNALYWIGECHFGLGHFDDAVNYFQRVMSEQPDGNKVPDAMLKMSLAYDRTGRGDQAKRLLEDLTRQFPATNAGRLATQKLAERP